MKKITYLLLTIIIISCNDGTNETFSTIDASFQGLVQKGPYVSGSSIIIQELDDGFIPNGKTYHTTIADDFGSFALKRGVSTPYVEIIAQGFYFNEVKGELSSANLLLRSLVKVETELTSNINLLTTLSKDRIIYLVENEDALYEDANIQASEELLAVFGITSEEVEFESMDMSIANDNSAILIAVSSIMQGTNTVAELSELISKFIIDFTDDGSINSEDIKKHLKSNSSRLNLNSIRSNLESRYHSLGHDLDVPNFESYTKKILDLNIDIEGDLSNYYSFEGSANDISGNNLDASLYMVNYSADMNGLENKAISFQGNGYYVDFPRTINPVQSDWTFSIWFNLDQLPSTRDDAFLLTRKQHDNSSDIYLYIDDADNNIKTGIASSRSKISSGVAISSDTWYHGAITYSQNLLSIYVNGELMTISESQFTSSDSFNEDFRIACNIIDGWNGYDEDKGRIFGSIDNVRIYNRELTKREISELYITENTTNSSGRINANVSSFKGRSSSMSWH